MARGEWSFLEFAIDNDVDPLVVESNQVFDLGEIRGPANPDH